MSDVDIQIIEATYARVRAVGVQRTNLAELATTLHISKKTIYRYFSSKEVLLQRVFQWYKQHASAEHQRCRQVLTAPEELRHLLHWFQEQHQALSPGFMPELRRAAPTLYASWHRYQATTLVRLVERNLQRGQAEGTYRLLDTQVLSRWFLAQLTLVLHDQLAPGFTVARQYQVVADLFLRGIIRSA
jgi:AcrR family transcriptional regulator